MKSVNIHYLWRLKKLLKKLLFFKYCIFVYKDIFYIILFNLLPIINILMNNIYYVFA